MTAHNKPQRLEDILEWLPGDHHHAINGDTVTRSISSTDGSFGTITFVGDANATYVKIHDGKLEDCPLCKKYRALL